MCTYASTNTVAQVLKEMPHLTKQACPRNFDENYRRKQIVIILLILTEMKDSMSSSKFLYLSPK